MNKSLLESDASESEDSKSQLDNGGEFKVNEDFAKKFTYNKKREELRRREWPTQSV